MRASSFFLLSIGLTAPSSVMAQDLPPGPGSEIVARVCTTCHGLDVIARQQHDAAGWRVVVDTMVNQGASATDSEQGAIVKYLSQTFPDSDSTGSNSPGAH